MTNSIAQKILAQLVAQLDPKLRRYVSARVRNPDHAEDLVAEIWCRCARAFERYERDLRKPRALFYEIRKGCLVDYYRTQSREGERFDPDITCVDELEGSSPTRGFHLRPYVRETDEVMTSKLTTNELITLELRVFEELPTKEIAKILGITDQAVRNRLTAARKKLAKHLELPVDEFILSEVDEFDEIYLQVAEVGRALGL